MPSTPIDPIRLYEISGTRYPILCAVCVFGIANNQLVVSSVSGYSIRVMGWDIQSNTAVQGTMVLKSASGGTALMSAKYAPPNTAAPWSKPITDSGYFETTTGQGLYCDVTAAAVNLDVYYIQYQR